jgi:hypothetical protein
MRNEYVTSAGKPEGKVSIWRPRRRWENNIKADVEEQVYKDENRIPLAQGLVKW